MDETSKQLVGETRRRVPTAAGRPARSDYEYVRCGTADVFLFCAPLAGRRWVRITTRRTKVDWALNVQALVDGLHPQAEKIVLVRDKLNRHAAASRYEAFRPPQAKRLADRLEIHYPPQHGSGLNVAEIELGMLARQCLGRRIDNAAQRAREAAAWQAARNTKEVRGDWRFTTAAARTKLKKLSPSIDG